MLKDCRIVRIMMLFFAICTFVLVFASCGKEDTTYLNEKHNTVADIERFIEEVGLKEKYSDFVFSVDGTDSGCWLEARSYEFLVEDAVEIIELAKSKNIGIWVYIGSIYTIEGLYWPDSRTGEGWCVLGYGLDPNGEALEQLNDVSTEEVLEVYYEHKNDTPPRAVLERLMTEACQRIYYRDATNKMGLTDQHADFSAGYEFVKYYNMISELEPVEITEENSGMGYYKEYFIENYEEYITPINNYVDGETWVFQYIQGDLIIDTRDWTSTIVCKDNSHLLNVEENELEQSVQSVYYSMTELQKGGQNILFDNASLWTIANNWEELKNDPIAGQPVDCITYGDRIKFVYGNGLTLVWYYNEDRIDAVSEDVDAQYDSTLEQKLFDSINYACSLGMTSNCDMSQETLKQLYEKIEDGSFFEESMFSYVGACGKDRFNYYISYDSLNVAVYCDHTTGLYGFEFETSE